KRDKFTCQYCGRSAGGAEEVVLEVDHIHPVALDGENDLLNLVTSCWDCNRGKGKRTLDDATVVKASLAEMDALALRREQLQMLLEWRQELRMTDDLEIEMFEQEWKTLTGFGLSEKGRASIGRIIKKYGLKNLLHALDEVQYMFGNTDNASQ